MRERLDSDVAKLIPDMAEQIAMDELDLRLSAECWRGEHDKPFLTITCVEVHEGHKGRGERLGRLWTTPHGPVIVVDRLSRIDGTDEFLGGPQGLLQNMGGCVEVGCSKHGIWRIPTRELLANKTPRLKLTRRHTWALPLR